MEIEHSALSQGLAVVVVVFGLLGGLFIVATFPGDQAGQVRMGLIGVALLLVLQGLIAASQLFESQ